jgi:hypothetical protein
MELLSTALGILEKAVGLGMKMSQQDKAALRPVLALLRGRDVTSAPACAEMCEATYQSVRQIRDLINTQIGVTESFELAQSLRDMERSCRFFMRDMEIAGLATKTCPSNAQEWQSFRTILVAFQKELGTAANRLAQRYNVIVP